MRTACDELERGLQQAGAKHMRWCLNKLFALPSRSDGVETTAFLTENYIEVCGHVPADLWTEATRELLRTKKFRPVPSEFLAVAEPLLRQRRRMLDRARTLTSPQAAAPQHPRQMGEDRIRAERMRRLGDATILRKHNRHATAARWERELAEMQGRPVEDIPEVPPTNEPIQREPVNPLPQSVRVKILTLESRIAFWLTQEGADAHVAGLEQQLADLVGPPS